MLSRVNFTNKESNVMNLIADNELSIININTIVSLTGKQYIDLKPILKKLVHNEQLYRIEKGLYCVRNFRNPYSIANVLLKDSAIAYWSALNLHNLTEQIPNVVFSQSVLLKNDKKVFNVRYKFVKVKAQKVCGIIEMDYGSEKFRVTDKEKTILDCFDLPQYAGGYEELIRAFYQGKVNSSKMLTYGKQMNNLSVLKRIAFLSELFEMHNFKSFQTEILKLINNRYTLLDPMGEDTGAFNSKWKIRVNISNQKLLEIINKMY